MYIGKHNPCKALLTAILLSTATYSSTASALSDGSTSSGDLVMIAWDLTTQTDFALDLGYTVNQFLANPPSSQTWNLGASFSPFISSYNNGDTISFIIVGDNQYLPKTVANSGYGEIQSAWTSVNQTGLILANSSLAQDITQTRSDLNAINGNGVPGAIPNTWTAAAADNSSSAWVGSWVVSYRPFGTQSYASLNNVGQNPNYQYLNLYWLSPAGDVTPSHHTTITQIGNGLSFGLDMVNGNLVATSAVPLPGSVWLFLSAMFGLFGISKRRSTLAV